MARHPLDTCGFTKQYGVYVQVSVEEEVTERSTNNGGEYEIGLMHGSENVLRRSLGGQHGRLRCRS